jgi:D-alanine-D-alanine ligase
MNEKIKIAVVFGGYGSESEVSCNSGLNCIFNLDVNKYEITPIRLMPNKSWKEYKYSDILVFKQFNTFCKISILEEFFQKINSIDYSFLSFFESRCKDFDVVLNTIHGEFGEDGAIQTILELFKIPQVGPSRLNATITMDKFLTGELLEINHINVPKTVLIQLKKNFLDQNEVNLITSSIRFPIVAKPNTDGSSSGLFFIKDLESLVKQQFPPVDYLFQEKISGLEFTVPAVRIGDYYKVFKSILVKLPSNINFDYQAKYLSTSTEEICPAPIEEKLEKRLRNITLKTNEILECKSATRTDLIYDPISDKIFVLEINTVPGMTKSSFLPKFSLENGYSFSELLNILIKNELR